MRRWRQHVRHPVVDRRVREPPAAPGNGRRRDVERDGREPAPRQFFRVVPQPAADHQRPAPDRLRVAPLQPPDAFVFEAKSPGGGGEGFQGVLTVGAGDDAIRGPDEETIERIVPPARADLEVSGGAGAPAVGATPAAPPPSACRVAPRAAADLVGLAGALPAKRGARPNATPIALPAGEPADEAVVAAVTATIGEYHACINAGDPRRGFALFTDAGLRRSALRFGRSTAGGAAAPAPAPLPDGERFFPRRVRDVRLLPDGRIAAVVVTSNQPLEAQGTFDDEFLQAATFLFVEIDGRYLIDDVVPDPTDDTPTS